ncbi:glycoside hydrolase family 3 C-terminal domain-containing protein [Stakelama sp. CBK3Z-3]|uniref:beta-glucosidase n=1 Tax=Stakelama flava TaxID=2860338 RepID=A0ABS6XPD0_9SPHN|nr:glycoside hydrolase family 3 N-terminal domain-containing protein [Stakelama flava]MBW4332069.1 glycoside hydrolase family 3 C-terminal domain-containing protein [Stakelama flava]
MADMRISRRAAILGAGAIAAWSASPARALLRTVDDEALALPADVETLIGQMTLEEKAGQLTLMAAAWAGGAATALNPPGKGGSFDDQLEQVRRGRLTGVFNGAGAEMARRMQTAAMRHQRIKIPLIFAADVIHGFRTVFPVPLGEAASFDLDLARRTARAAAVEASAAGIDWTFAPMVDIARDSRWGRTVEGAGEDVLLGVRMAKARVAGFQGKSLQDDDTVLSCAKHFAAYGAAESGLDYNTVNLSERVLRDVYLPPFKAALEAGSLSMMAAFNELSGIPATGNHWLMDEVLHGEWGFEGLVVSDYTGDLEMVAHGYAKDARDAARIAFLAGVDMSMQSGLYIQYLPDLVRSGDVPMARLDQAVRRVLAVKAKLGLFDDPFRRIDPKREKTRIRTPQMLSLSREAARSSIVMLKNEGDLLPLPRSGKRIALIGPFASGKHDLIGPWNVYGTDDQAVDLATGVKAAVKDPALVTATAGSDVEKPIDGGIEAAVAAANAADIVVLAIGEAQNMSGEAQARTSITIPAPQQELAEAVAATGKPMVILLKNGRALALEGAVADAPAILVTWFLGSESGPATADILFGEYGPSARLPVSFPFKSGQEPYYYAHKSTGRPNPPGELQPYKAHFRGVPNKARFAFGHGLTYGDMVYSALDIGTGRLDWNGALTVTATVTNQGTRKATEVVQLYIHDRAASITRPVRELKGFSRVELAPGASQRVTFTLKRDDLEFIGPDNLPTVEPGSFDIWIAPSAQDDGVNGSFELVRS